MTLTGNGGTEMPKPTFILGKGAGKGQLETSPLEQHYRRVFRGLMDWDGLPEKAPKNFPQDCIFYTGGIGCKRMKGFGPILAGVDPSTLTVYGTPYEWIPQPIGMAMDLNNEFFQPSNDPNCWIGESVRNLIRPYLDIMERTMKTLNQNLIALQQPIMLKGIPGAELPAMVFKNELLDTQSIIPSTGAGFNAEILDLKAQDHTQNLVSTIDWCDARILEVMMSSNGVEKASGITTLETVSGVQSIMQEFNETLERCRAFCDECNSKFGLSMSVRPGKGIETLMEPRSQPMQGGGDDEQTA